MTREWILKSDELGFVSIDTLKRGLDRFEEVGVVEKCSFDKLQSENTTLKAHLEHLRIMSQRLYDKVDKYGDSGLIENFNEGEDSLGDSMDNLNHALAVTSSAPSAQELPKVTPPTIEPALTLKDFEELVK
jgi:hypothetical protein